MPNISLQEKQSIEYRAIFAYVPRGEVRDRAIKFLQSVHEQELAEQAKKQEEYRKTHPEPEPKVIPQAPVMVLGKQDKNQYVERAPLTRTCVACGAEFERPIQRGQPPKKCPACR